jgi:type III secretory pathway component EscT
METILDLIDTIRINARELLIGALLIATCTFGYWAIHAVARFQDKQRVAVETLAHPNASPAQQAQQSCAWIDGNNRCIPADSSN